MEHRRKNRMRLTLWLLVVLWMGLIFLFSAQNGDESSQTSGLVVRWLLTTLDRSFLTLSPEGQLARMEAWSFAVRKLAHFTVFAGLGLLSCAALAVDLPPRRAFFGALGLGILRAVLDEVHQSFVPGRACELRDMGIDGAGVLLGAGALLLVLILARRRKWRE